MNSMKFPLDRVLKGLSPLCFGIFMLLGSAATVAAPAPASAKPYWQDPAWTQQLVKAIHNNVLYPGKAIKSYIVQGEGTVAFDYRDGKLVNPVLVKSTGHAILDKAITDGILATKPPPVDSADRNVAHHFQVSLVLEPDREQFRAMLYSKIATSTNLAPNQYPADPAIVDIHVNYKDGKLGDFKMKRIQGPAGIDTQVQDSMGSIALPQPPQYLADASIPIWIRVCIAKQYSSCVSDYLGDWGAAHGLTFVMTPPS